MPAGAAQSPSSAPLRYGCRVTLYKQALDGYVVSTSSAAAPVGVKRYDAEAGSSGGVGSVAFEQTIFVVCAGDPAEGPGGADPDSADGTVKYGKMVRLLHQTHQQPLCYNKEQHAAGLKGNLRVGLEKRRGRAHIGDRWRIMPRYRLRFEGEPVADGDPVVLQSSDGERYLNVCDRYDEEMSGGGRFYEVSCGSELQGFQVGVYDGDVGPHFPAATLRCGDCVTLLHTEEHKYVLADVGSRTCLLQTPESEIDGGRSSYRVGGGGLSVHDRSRLVDIDGHPCHGGGVGATSNVLAKRFVSGEEISYLSLFVIEAVDPSKGGAVRCVGGRYLYRLKSFATGLYLQAGVVQCEQHNFHFGPSRVRHAASLSHSADTTEVGGGLEASAPSMEECTTTAPGSFAMSSGSDRAITRNGEGSTSGDLEMEDRASPEGSSGMHARGPKEMMSKSEADSSSHTQQEDHQPQTFSSCRDEPPPVPGEDDEVVADRAQAGAVPAAPASFKVSLTGDRNTPGTCFRFIAISASESGLLSNGSRVYLECVDGSLLSMPMNGSGGKLFVAAGPPVRDTRRARITGGTKSYGAVDYAVLSAHTVPHEEEVNELLASSVQCMRDGLEVRGMDVRTLKELSMVRCLLPPLSRYVRDMLRGRGDPHHTREVRENVVELRRLCHRRAIAGSLGSVDADGVRLADERNEVEGVLNPEWQRKLFSQGVPALVLQVAYSTIHCPYVTVSKLFTADVVGASAGEHGGFVPMRYSELGDLVDACFECVATLVTGKPRYAESLRTYADFMMKCCEHVPSALKCLAVFYKDNPTYVELPMARSRLDFFLKMLVSRGRDPDVLEIVRLFAQCGEESMVEAQQVILDFFSDESVARKIMCPVRMMKPMWPPPAESSHFNQREQKSDTYSHDAIVEQQQQQQRHLRHLRQKRFFRPDGLTAMVGIPHSVFTFEDVRTGSLSISTHTSQRGSGGPLDAVLFGAANAVDTDGMTYFPLEALCCVLDDWLELREVFVPLFAALIRLLAAVSASRTPKSCDEFVFRWFPKEAVALAFRRGVELPPFIHAAILHLFMDAIVDVPGTLHLGDELHHFRCTVAAGASTDNSAPFSLQSPGDQTPSCGVPMVKPHPLVLESVPRYLAHARTHVLDYLTSTQLSGKESVIVEYAAAVRLLEGLILAGVFSFSEYAFVWGLLLRCVDPRLGDSTSYMESEAVHHCRLRALRLMGVIVNVLLAKRSVELVRRFYGLTRGFPLSQLFFLHQENTHSRGRHASGLGDDDDVDGGPDRGGRRLDGGARHRHSRQRGSSSSEYSELSTCSSDEEAEDKEGDVFVGGNAPQDPRRTDSTGGCTRRQGRATGRRGRGRGRRLTANTMEVLMEIGNTTQNQRLRLHAIELLYRLTNYGEELHRVASRMQLLSSEESTELFAAINEAAAQLERIVAYKSFERSNTCSLARQVLDSLFDFLFVTSPSMAASSTSHADCGDGRESSSTVAAPTKQPRHQRVPSAHTGSSTMARPASEVGERLAMMRRVDLHQTLVLLLQYLPLPLNDVCLDLLRQTVTLLAAMARGDAHIRRELRVRMEYVASHFASIEEGVLLLLRIVYARDPAQNDLVPRRVISGVIRCLRSPDTAFDGLQFLVDMLGIRTSSGHTIMHRQQVVWQELVSDGIAVRKIQFRTSWCGDGARQLRERALLSRDYYDPHGRLARHLLCCQLVFLMSNANMLVRPAEIRHEVFGVNSLDAILDVTTDLLLPAFFRSPYVLLLQALVLDDPTAASSLYAHRGFPDFLRMCVLDTARLLQLCGGRLRVAENEEEELQRRETMALACPPSSDAEEEEEINVSRFSTEVYEGLVLGPLCGCIARLCTQYAAGVERLDNRLRSYLQLGINEVIDALCDFAELHLASANAGGVFEGRGGGGAKFERCATFVTTSSSVSFPDPSRWTLQQAQNLANCFQMAEAHGLTGTSKWRGKAFARVCGLVVDYAKGRIGGSVADSQQAQRRGSPQQLTAMSISLPLTPCQQQLRSKQEVKQKESRRPTGYANPKAPLGTSPPSPPAASSRPRAQQAECRPSSVIVLAETALSDGASVEVLEGISVPILKQQSTIAAYDDEEALSEKWGSFLDATLLQSESMEEAHLYASAAGVLLRTGDHGTAFVRTLLCTLPAMGADYVTRTLQLVRQLVLLQKDDPHDASSALTFSSVTHNAATLTLDLTLAGRQSFLRRWCEKTLVTDESIPLIAVICNLVSAPSRSVQRASLLAATTLLSGGHRGMQESYYRYCMSTPHEQLFFVLRNHMTGFLDELRTYHYALTRGSTPSEAQHFLKHMAGCTLELQLLRLLCAGQFAPIQTYLVAQPDNTVSVNLIELLVDLVSMGPKAADEVTAPFFLQLLSTISETLQGPCRVNQDSFVAYKVADYLTQLLADEDEDEMDLNKFCFAKGSMIAVPAAGKNRQWRVRLQTAALSTLLALIEGRQDPTFAARLLATVDLSVLGRSMDRSAAAYERRHGPITRAQSRGLLRGDFRGSWRALARYISDYIRGDYPTGSEELQDELALGVSIYTFFRALYDMQCLAVTCAMRQGDGKARFLTESLKEFVDKRGRTIRQVLRGTTYYEAVGEKVGKVEVVRDGTLERVYFRILSTSKDNLYRATRVRVIREAVRASDNERLQYFFNSTSGIICEINSYSRRRKYIVPFLLNYTADELNLFSLFIAFAINVLLLCGIRAPNTPYDDSWASRSVSVALLVLGIINLVVEALLVLQSLMGPAMVRLHCKWDAYRANQGDQVAWMALRNIASDSWERMRRGKRLALVDVPRYERIGRSVYYVCTTVILFEHALFLFVSIMGLSHHVTWYSFLLLQLTLNSSVLDHLLVAVRANLIPLIYTFVLMLFVMFIFSIISFFNFAELFDPLGDAGNGLNCYTLAQCWFVHLDTIRLTGGMGEIANWPTFYSDSGYGTIFAFFRLVYFVVVVLVVSNLFLGVIVDSLAQARQISEFIADDQQKKCFICGVERNVFDVIQPGMYDTHIKEEHNMWQYVFFLHYLSEKDPDTFTGQETYVSHLISLRDITFYPIGRSVVLAAVSERDDGGDGVLKTKVNNYSGSHRGDATGGSCYTSSGSLKEDAVPATAQESVEEAVQKAVAPLYKLLEEALQRNSGNDKGSFSSTDRNGKRGDIVVSGDDPETLFAPAGLQSERACLGAGGGGGGEVEESIASSVNGVEGEPRSLQEHVDSNET